MKNSILNLGKTLNKAEQKQVNGGVFSGPVYKKTCSTSEQCPSGYSCDACGNCVDQSKPSFDCY